MKSQLLGLLGIITLTFLPSCYTSYQTTSKKDTYIKTNWGSGEGYRSNPNFSILERYKDTYRPFFIEEYYDNYNDWRTESDENWRCYVSRGFYHHIIDWKIGVACPISVSGLEDLEEYIIELSLFIDGGYFYDDECDVGLTMDWVVEEEYASGMKSCNPLWFEIGMDNSVWIGHYDDGKKGYTGYCSYINLKHNILSIVVEGNSTKYYINGKLVHTLPYKYKISNNEIGPQIGYVSARFDYLKIYQKK
jgi:hypothetical protein